MGIGSVANILVCQPRQDGGPAITPCGADTSGTSYQPQVIRAYVIDPASAGYLDPVAEPFDYVQASGIWSAAFSMVVGLYFVSTSIGAVLGMVRKR